MFAATPSAIQYWTLGVAATAVIASASGIYLSHYFSTKSEHKTWQRDIRIQVYSALAIEIYAFRERARQLPEPDSAALQEIFNKISPKVSDVRTFGSKEVGQAALELFKQLLALQFRGFTREQNSVVYDKSELYFDALRKSLKIDDD
jgi:hypothetical protein